MRAIIILRDDSEMRNEMADTLIKDVQRMCIEERCSLALNRLSTVIDMGAPFPEIHARLVTENRDDFETLGVAVEAY